MKKIIVLLKEVFDLLKNSKISSFTRFTFCCLYLYHLVFIILLNPKVKKTIFLNRKSFFYIGNHINLLLDHLHINLNCYYPFYKEATNILDVGAAFGDFSLIANYMNPAAKIYAFEPAKLNYGMLQKNCQHSNKISTVNAAVGDINKDVRFQFDNDYPEGSKVVDKKSSHDYVVNQITLDSFISSQKIKRISLLKIDVEGFELKVLQGAEKTLSKVDAVIVEIDISILKNLLEVLSCLNKYDFSLVNFGSLNINPNSKIVGSLDFIFIKDYINT